MLRSLFAPLAVVATLAVAARAQTPPAGSVIGSGLQAPLDFCFLADGRVLIANRAGDVSIYAGGVPVTIGTVPNVESGGERGLLSIIADPDFDLNGFFYVYYSSSADAFMHLDRFTCTGVLSSPTSTAVSFASASRRVILAAIPDNAFNHNGGAARFGPDGMLYLTIGDDAVSCNAQSTTTSGGCLLRMNVDVSVLGSGGSTTPPAFTALDPGTNPLSANADVSQLVIAHGLRNPFRMEIDQLTGNCYIGDVGLSTREEYTEYVYPTSGPLPLRNFGWPWREGLTSGGGCSGSQPPGLVDPLADEGSSTWNSIMGGPRYRNQGGAYDFGASFEGDGFYLDFFGGELRRLDHNGTSWPAGATTWTTGFAAVAALRQGPDGGLWFCQNTSTSPSSGGTLKRIRPLGPTNSVQAISGSGQIGPAGQTFPMPLVARVFNSSNQPLPGGTVNFAVSGPGILSTNNPVIADGSGYALTTVTATSTAGGLITVTASTPNSQTNGVFTVNSRKLTVTVAGTILVVTITNATTAVPAQVPMIVAMSFPRTPILPTFFGTVFANPYYATTLVLEDPFGHFPTVPWAGTGGIGAPGLTKIYQNVPMGMWAGQRMTFQVAGVDPITGWFLTNIEVKQF
jgi:glucose/arabinose dehydrogenase